MEILKLGAELLTKKLGLSADSSTVTSALGSLLGGDGNGLDIGSLVSKFAGQQGISSLVDSWLGDGENQAISPANIMSILGKGSIGEFASKIGVDEESAASGLSSVLPEMIDKASSGGKLLENAGGLLGMAKKFF